MTKKECTSTMNGGLVMDLNPLSTPNDVLSYCLNGTLITHNGNEMMLQNDMGNCKVEGASLPQGYVPVGTTSYGGIIYVASYNPSNGLCQIGSFPSPQQDFSESESDFNKNLSKSCFIDSGGNIHTTKFLIQLTEDQLSPGDLFKINLSKGEGNLMSLLSAYGDKQSLGDEIRQVRLRLCTINSIGKIVYLSQYINFMKDKDGHWYYMDVKSSNNEESTSDNQSIEFPYDNYSVFEGIENGRLYISAELEVIDTFDVIWDADKNTDDNIIIKFYAYWNSERDFFPERINPEYIYLPDFTLKTTEGNSELKAIINNPVLSNSDTGESVYELKEIDNYTYNKKLMKEDNVKYSQGKYFCFATVYIKKEDGKYKVDSLSIVDVTKGKEGILTFKTSEETSEELEALIIDENNTLHTSFIPAMCYGKLLNLKKDIHINLDNINSGNILIGSYKYLYQEDSMFLEMYLMSYAKDENPITSIKIYKQEVGRGNIESIIKGTYDYTRNPNIEVKFTKNTTYTGLYEHTFHFNEFFKKEACYYLSIVADFTNGTQQLIANRFMFTTPQWNDQFNLVEDFDILTLDDCIKLQPSITSNIHFPEGGLKTTYYINNKEINKSTKLGYSDSATSKYFKFRVNTKGTYLQYDNQAVINYAINDSESQLFTANSDKFEFKTSKIDKDYESEQYELQYSDNVEPVAVTHIMQQLVYPDEPVVLNYSCFKAEGNYIFLSSQKTSGFAFGEIQAQDKLHEKDKGTVNKQFYELSNINDGLISRWGNTGVDIIPALFILQANGMTNGDNPNKGDLDRAEKITSNQNGACPGDGQYPMGKNYSATIYKRNMGVYDMGNIGRNGTSTDTFDKISDDFKLAANHTGWLLLLCRNKGGTGYLGIYSTKNKEFEDARNKSVPIKVNVVSISDCKVDLSADALDKGVSDKTMQYFIKNNIVPDYYKLVESTEEQFIDKHLIKSDTIPSVENITLEFEVEYNPNDFNINMGDIDMKYIQRIKENGEEFIPPNNLKCTWALEDTSTESTIKIKQPIEDFSILFDNTLIGIRENTDTATTIEELRPENIDITDCIIYLKEKDKYKGQPQGISYAKTNPVNGEPKPIYLPVADVDGQIVLDVSRADTRYVRLRATLDDETINIYLCYQ